MHRLKILVCVMIIANLIFAEEIKSDSSALNLSDLLKRQKLFYAVGNNSNFPTNDDCVGLGCCLIPLTGCTIIGRDIFAKDTTKKDTAQVSKSRWVFGIGYSGGVCYTGDDLVKALKPGEEFSADFTRLLYWLNSIEVEVFWKKSIIVGLSTGYMWTKLEQRESHIQGAWENESWFISGVPLQINVANNLNKKVYIKYAIYGTLLSVIDTEKHFVFNDLTGGWYYDRQVDVLMYGVAVGFGLMLRKNIQVSQGVNFYYTVGFDIHVGHETKNNLPSDLIEKWKGKMEFNFSGIKVSIGLQILNFNR